MPELLYFPEPRLLFNFDQAMLDPRDGLTLFGPLDKAKPDGIRWGVVGTAETIDHMKHWVRKIQRPVVSGDNLIARPIFPGFEAAFRTRWSPQPVLELVIDDRELWDSVRISDKHQRVFGTVDLFSERIEKAINSEDVSPDIWCVVIPDYVYRYCRPNSVVPPEMQIKPKMQLSKKVVKEAGHQPFLYEESNQLIEQYLYDVNFHHQLKARLLHLTTPTQIIRQSTIAHDSVTDQHGQPTRDLENLQSAIAWGISTAFFYKSGGRPWKLGATREGVCYIGLVFKQDEHYQDPKTACCAAQMFLDSGDGVVFKGAVGPWYREKRGHFHLNKKSAKEIVEMCVGTYKERNGGKAPRELFIHGQIALDDEEWAGFQEGAGDETSVVGVRIRPVSGFKLYRLGDHPIMRGLAYALDDRKGYLWTRGMIPRLRTYPGREVPNPILVDICRGDAEIQTVMSDILALTKLNYNACSFADGLPVTLKFANAVGEILTAGPPTKQVPPLPFKFYI